MNPDIYASLSEIESTHWWFVARRKYIDKLISKFIESDKNNIFCEVGCGTGGNFSLLATHAKLDAVEIEKNAIDIAKNKNISGVRKIEYGFLPDNIPFSGPYDAVFSLDVIEHVNEDLESLRRLKNLVSEDGTIIITVPAYQWLWSNHDELAHHYRRYTQSQITNLAEKAGLSVVYSSYFNTILFPLAAASRVAEKIVNFFGKSDFKPNHLDVPSRFVNHLFNKIFSLEKYVAGKFCLPFGLSIVVVAKRKQ